MMSHEAHEGRSPAARPGRHRLLPIAGGGVAIAALLAHFGGGALVLHVGLPAALVYLGLSGAPVIGILAVAVITPLLVFGARHWLRHR